MYHKIGGKLFKHGTVRLVYMKPCHKKIVQATMQFKKKIKNKIRINKLK